MIIWSITIYIYISGNNIFSRNFSHTLQGRRVIACTKDNNNKEGRSELCLKPEESLQAVSHFCGMNIVDFFARSCLVVDLSALWPFFLKTDHGVALFKHSTKRLVNNCSLLCAIDKVLILSMVCTVYYSKSIKFVCF